MKPILLKSRVKAHQRHTKSGKVVQVRQHEDTRTKKEGWKVTDRRGGIAVAWEMGTVTITKETRKKTRSGTGGTRYMVRRAGDTEYGALSLEGAQNWAKENSRARLKLADRKAINELKEQRNRLGDKQRGNRQLLQPRIVNL